MALLEKLDQAGRLALLPARAVLKSLGAAIFCVPKNLLEDRLIMDSRPFNSVQTVVNRWLPSLASSSALASLSLEPSEYLAASGEDIQDFFYSFKISGERLVRNALNMQVNLTTCLVI